MKKRFFLFLFFSFFFFQQNIFALVYAQKSYAPSFLEKIKGVASWIFYQYRMRGHSGDVVIPIKIYLGYGWDWALIYWNSNQLSWTSTEGQLTRCDPPKTGYYNLTAISCDGLIVQAYPKVPQPYLCGSFFWNIRGFMGRDLYSMTAFNLDVSTRVAVGSGVMVNPDDPTYYRFTLLAQQEYFFPVIRDNSIVNLPPVNLEGKNFLTSTNDFLKNINKDNPHNIDIIQYIPETHQYFRDGYLDGRGSVIGSSSTYNIDDSSYTIVSDTASVPIVSTSTSSVYVINEATVIVKNNINVSVDMSTTNQKIEGIYNFLTSTNDNGISYNVYNSSISYATTTVQQMFSHIENFFIPSSSDTWDCSFHFGTITFLTSSFNLGSVNLCERWGWVFDLLRSMLRLGAYVMAFFIISEGV